MRGLLAISKAIDWVLQKIAFVGAWFFIACIITICFDVVTRKIGYQLNLFGIDLGSTRLQELTWHFHGILFLTWLGYTYIANAHVRIDILTNNMSARKQAWAELIGCIVFAIPYLSVAVPFAYSFFVLSYMQLEGSNAPNGLPYRFIIKGFLFYGLASVAFAVLSVMLRRIVFLFGSPDIADEAMGGRAAGRVH